MNREDIFAGIDIIWDDDSSDLVYLAEKLGYSAEFFYIGTNLSGTDLRGQDLSGVNLHGTNIGEAILDRATVIDEEYDPRIGQTKSKRYLELDKSLLSYLTLFYHRDKYYSVGMFIKEIIKEGMVLLRRNPEGWYKTISRSPEILSFLNSNNRHRVELVIDDHVYEVGVEFGRRFGGRSAGITSLILVGLVGLIGYDPGIDTVPITRERLIYEYRLFPANFARHDGPKMKLKFRQGI